MENMFFMTLLMFLIVSCKDDDDSHVDSNPIIGMWIMESTTETDYYVNLGGPNLACVNIPTSLEVNLTTTTIKELVVNVAPNKQCVIGDSSRITEDEIIFAEDGDSGALGTFPPPKNKFKYKIEEGKLILTDGANNDFIFIKDN